MANLASYQKITRVLPGYVFGDGRDGALIISSNTTQSLGAISCSGSASSTSLTLGSAGLTNGNIVIVYQTRGTGAGQWEVNQVLSGGGTTSITLSTALQFTYTDSGASQAQVFKLPLYTTITVNPGITWSTSAWDGDIGGIMAFAANVSIGGSGSLALNATGYRPGTGAGGAIAGAQGEGSTADRGTQSINANDTGGGGGSYASNNQRQGGGGGGYASSGSTGGALGGSNPTPGLGGGTVGVADLTSIFPGGGGGAGSGEGGTDGGTTGGTGGGVLFAFVRNFDISSFSSSNINGGNGVSGANSGAGGGGAGGSGLIACQTATLGTNILTASGGSGGDGYSTADGGGGGNGRIAIHHSGTVSGTTTPAFTDVTDSTLIGTLFQNNSVKASIKTTIYYLSSRADIKTSNVIKANSAKASIMTGIKLNSTKAYIPTQTQSISSLANIKKIFTQKKFDYRVFDSTGTSYITTWSSEVISTPHFRTIINGGPGEMIVRLVRTFDDFGEGIDVGLFNTVECWCFDREAPNGVLVYSGFISGYRPVLDGHSEYLEVTLLHQIAQTSQIMLKTASGTTQLAEYSQDPSQIFKDIIDLFQADGGKLTYTADTVDDTGTTATYIFQTYTVKEALDKAIELTPQYWFWRVDADNTTYLKQSDLNTADHSFVIARHISQMETWRRGEDIVNRVYFFGQESGNPPEAMYRVYSNTGSISSYGVHAVKKTDNRVSTTSTADIMANRIINQKKDPEIRTTLTILDTNGTDVYKGYDIETIKVGQTMRIRNIHQGTKTVSLWDQMLWDVDVWDQTLSYTASDIIQIMSVEYYPNYVVIEASSRLPEISKRVEDVYRNAEDNFTISAPGTPTPG